MSHMHRPCQSCALTISRQLVDGSGISQLMLVSGAMEEQVRCVAVDGSLMLLVRCNGPSTLALERADDVVAQVKMTDRQGNVAVSLLGWLQQLDAGAMRAVADRFAERHLTTDLLDLGVEWNLLSMEVVETHLQWDDEVVTLDADESTVALGVHGG
jgi:hypothetical protein